MQSQHKPLSTQLYFSMFIDIFLFYHTYINMKHLVLFETTRFIFNVTILTWLQKRLGVTHQSEQEQTEQLLQPQISRATSHTPPHAFKVHRTLGNIHNHKISTQLLQSSQVTKFGSNTTMWIWHISNTCCVYFVFFKVWTSDDTWQYSLIIISIKNWS